MALKDGKKRRRTFIYPNADPLLRTSKEDDHSLQASNITKHQSGS